MPDRFAILADIHANLQALTAVLSRVDELDCDGIFCLGDMVGYGARPAECLDLLLGRRAQCLIGNHEALVLGITDPRHFNPAARLAVEYTREQLRPEQLEMLGALPERLEADERTLMVHGSPAARDAYLLTGIDLDLAREGLADSELNLCFFGHTHLPVCHRPGDRERTNRPDSGPKALNPAELTLVNPGSVGQPRDRDPAAAFAWWDRTARAVVFERVAYDVEAARRDILAADLPQALGDRLRMGR